MDLGLMDSDPIHDSFQPKRKQRGRATDTLRAALTRSNIMTRYGLSIIVLFVFFLQTSLTHAAEFELLTGVDALLTPGTDRLVFPDPGPGFPGTFDDGDRLAGTADVGDVAEFDGIGIPFFDPNEFGSLSFTFRRGSVPIPPDLSVPILGTDFLGGPLLDLDGDLENGVRSLVPVEDAEPVIIPDTTSFVDLAFDFNEMAIELLHLDATGTNVGAPNIQAEIATTLNVLAGTENDATPGDPINPEVDTRMGDLVEFTGLTGSLEGVFRIENLGFESWQDSIDPNSSSADVLGTFQFLGTFDGWLILRNPVGGQFPTLTGQGLGSTRWPEVNVDFVGQQFNTANGLQGGTARIVIGVPGDDFSVPGNGGLPMTDLDGDLGAYLDQVVIPLLDDSAHSIVYLESAGFGINNSFDPVFFDSVGWDVVLVGASPCGLLPDHGFGDFDHNGVVDLFDYEAFLACVSGPGEPVDEGCEQVDLDGDGDGDLIDFGLFQIVFDELISLPDCEL